MSPAFAKPLRRSRWIRTLCAIGLVLSGSYLALAVYWQYRVRRAIALHPGASLEFRDYVPPPPTAAQTPWQAVEAALELLVINEAAGEDGKPKVATDPEIRALQRRFVDLDLGGRLASEAELAGFRSVVKRFGRSLEIVDRAMPLETEARFLADYEVAPMALAVPRPLRALNLADLLRARAEVAMAEGRRADAWHDALAIYRLGYWVSTSSYSSQNVVTDAVLLRYGNRLVQSLLSTAPAEPAARRAVLAEAQRSDPVFLMERGWHMDRAGTFATIIDPRLSQLVFEESTAEEKETYARFGWLPGWKPWLNWNAVEYLEWSEKATALCREPARENGRERLLALVAEIPWWAFVARIFSVDCTAFSEHRDIWRAGLDQLEIAMALEDFHDRNGRYPRQLAEADRGLAERIDPFADAPYRYRARGDGYKLYSLGLDGDDDDGRLLANEKHVLSYKTGDLVWQINNRSPD